MSSDEQSVGEIARSLVRLEQHVHASNNRHDAHALETARLIGNLSEKFDKYIGPVAVLEKQAQDTELILARHDRELREQGQMSARVSAFGIFAAFVASLIPWPWRK